MDIFCCWVLVQFCPTEIDKSDFRVHLWIATSIYCEWNSDFGGDTALLHGWSNTKYEKQRNYFNNLQGLNEIARLSVTWKYISFFIKQIQNKKFYKAAFVFINTCYLWKFSAFCRNTRKQITFIYCYHTKCLQCDWLRRV